MSTTASPTTGSGARQPRPTRALGVPALNQWQVECRVPLGELLDADGLGWSHSSIRDGSLSLRAAILVRSLDDEDVVLLGGDRIPGGLLGHEQCEDCEHVLMCWFGFTRA